MTRPVGAPRVRVFRSHRLWLSVGPLWDAHCECCMTGIGNCDWAGALDWALGHVDEFHPAPNVEVCR